MTKSTVACGVLGRPVQLVSTPRGLAWSTKAAGAVTLALHYGIDVRRSEGGTG